MVFVDMCVAQRVHKVAILQSARLRYHHGKQCIRCNIEWHPQKYVGRPLIELTAQPSLRHIELEQYVARRQMHLLQLAHIPRRHQQASRVRVAFYLAYQIAYLVHMAAVGTSPRTPLVSVYGTQLSVWPSPFVPNAHLVVVQVLHIRFATQKPQQLVYYRTQMQLFGGEQREAVVKVEPHLIAKHTDSARPCAVFFLYPVIQHMLQ